MRCGRGWLSDHLIVESQFPLLVHYGNAKLPIEKSERFEFICTGKERQSQCTLPGQYVLDNISSVFSKAYSYRPERLKILYNWRGFA